MINYEWILCDLAASAAYALPQGETLEVTAEGTD